MASAAEQLAANFNFGSISKAKELRSRIFFTLGALIVARIGTYIPMPGIDPAALAQQIQQSGSGLLDVFNTLAGGAVNRMAIFALGIMPYISASIIIQLMTTVFPELEALKKEAKRDAKSSTNTPAISPSCWPWSKPTASRSGWSISAAKATSSSIPACFSASAR